MKALRSRLPKPLLVAGVALFTLPTLTFPAVAVDHDNMDAGRPLDFDDAETVAFKEQAIEFGASLGKPARGKLGVAGDIEYLYGFAKNWHLNLGIDPEFAAENGGKRRFNVGDVNLGLQHNFNRETDRAPAFGVRADAMLPTGRDAEGVDFRVRGIASRKFGAFGRLHLNVDLNINNSPQAGRRRTMPGAILGYSKPISFPTRFDRTLVAQLGYRAAPDKNDSGVVNVGIGLRQQVTPRSVFDVGIKSDISGGGRDRERFRIVAGYSTAF